MRWLQTARARARPLGELALRSDPWLLANAPTSVGAAARPVEESGGWLAGPSCAAGPDARAASAPDVCLRVRVHPAARQVLVLPLRVQRLASPHCCVRCLGLQAERHRPPRGLWPVAARLALVLAPCQRVAAVWSGGWPAGRPHRVRWQRAPRPCRA